MKTVYIAMSADLITPGHMKIVQEARGFGEVVIGLLTDSAIAGHQRRWVLKTDRKHNHAASLV